jgi:PTS system nitrogen regulatory IIA component
MRFLSRLPAALIAVAPPWRSFAATITGLVDLLAREGVIPAHDAPAAVQAVVAREAEASTALFDIHAGVPHARLEGVEHPAVALAVSPPGLYEAVPTVAIQIVALVLSPPSAAADHLDTLAGIATLLRSLELRSALLCARDGHEALAALRRHARSLP